MSDTIEGLNRKIDSAKDLQTVVRTMKAMAAANIEQYECSVHALTDYYLTVEMGLGAYFRQNKSTALMAEQKKLVNNDIVNVIIFGSDQGLVGQFNDVISYYAAKTLKTLPGKLQVWAVGERVHASLESAGLPPKGIFAVPSSVKTITPLVGQILTACKINCDQDETAALYLFYNNPTSGEIYSPINQQLLPLDEYWQYQSMRLPWPTKNLPQIMDPKIQTLQALIREYLFVSIFRACAGSLASENASRLMAMQRADKNIDELLKNLGETFQCLRQNSIDEELFDVISGFEALGGCK